MSIKSRFFENTPKNFPIIYMMTQNNNPISYFQFCPEADIPVYIGVKMTFSRFEQNLTEFLTKNNFAQIQEKSKELQKPYARLLWISQASKAPLCQIINSKTLDPGRQEDIIPASGYHLYRYKNLALMIYSRGSKEWRLAGMQSFGDQDELTASRIVLAHFLSQALAPFSIIGFWGVPVDKGIVIVKKEESQGKMVFIHPDKNLLIANNTTFSTQERFRIIRFDTFSKKKQSIMKKEELFGQLLHHCIWIGDNTKPIHASVKKLVLSSTGIIHSKEYSLDDLSL